MLLCVFLSSGLIVACNNSVQDELDLKLGTFGAFYSKIDSGEEFEAYSRTGEYADIVVDLGRDGAKFVFWRGSSFSSLPGDSEG